MLKINAKVMATYKNIAEHQNQNQNCQIGFPISYFNLQLSVKIQQLFLENIFSALQSYKDDPKQFLQPRLITCL